MSGELPFLALLRSGVEHGGFEADDALRVWLPLCRQTGAAHEHGTVAPLRGVAFLTINEDGTLGFDPDRSDAPRDNRAAVERIQRPAASAALNIIGHSRVTTDVDAGSVARTNLDVAAMDAEITRPVYLPDYVAWEHRLGHHDALTDIFSLGMLLASLLCGLDFTDGDDLALFASNRRNLFALHAHLHPVLAAVIVEMTELDRHRRAPDLPSLARRLETYRDQSIHPDLGQVAETASGVANRRTAIQSHLRDRLFEISRRNRLIYFKGSQGTLNLTVASVPLVMDLRSVRLEQLFVWHPALAAEIVDGKPMGLGKYLRFEDQPYLPGALDKIISDARRDRAEYGFAQLRLVPCFLHWHNLKEAPEERIVSPLLLLPVELTKKKGVRDQYVLTPATSEAEVNPTLRHHLRQLYNLTLPESIDLRETTLETFHEQLSAQIKASEPGVTLRRVDQPRIELIHERARQRIDQFCRRQKLRKPARPATSFDYSYDREHPRPLGLQIFQAKVRPAPLPLRETAGAPPRPRLPHIAAAAATTEGDSSEIGRQAFALREETTGNRYTWDFDLCSVTLGNFNYRKMTLVRDYANLIESDLASDAFDGVFSLDPKNIETETGAALPTNDRWLVVPGDATQASAIAKARTGRSYIIQGPPGTGKSQTITNLIADHVACGKRVLFVCEKRAAIDVVFHRLKQQGLDELCCLIHDSQTDKKAFVQNLRQTYEKWLAEPDDAESIQGSREGIVRQIEREMEGLRRFSDAMGATMPSAGINNRRLFDRLIALRPHESALDARTMESLPGYAAWQKHGGAVCRLAAMLAELGHRPFLALHPFRWLAEATIHAERPLESLGNGIERAEGLLGEIELALSDSGLTPDHWDTLEEVAALLDFARCAEGLAERDHLALLDPASNLSHDFEDSVRQLREHARVLIAAREKTRGWRRRLSVDDAAAALTQVRTMGRSVFRWINPAWYRLRKVLNNAYDFSRHAVRPTYKQVLEDLVAEGQAETTANTAREEMRARFGVEDMERFTHDLEGLQRPSHPAVQALRDMTLRSPRAGGIIARLARIAPRFGELQQALAEILDRYDQHSFPTLGEALRGLRESIDDLPDLLPALVELTAAPPALFHAVRTLPWSPEQLETATARRSLDEFYRAERWLARCDGRIIERHMQEATRLQRDLLDQNAALIRAGVRRRFRENVNVSSLPVAQLTAEQKLFKKNYHAGRRALEHEFGKSMRYKSIRDMVADESGRVVRDLKPIWLMSPLSVSDTLPMQPNLFDVVIFDEASQVPVEEAVPALYRAPQVIVVGDEMQLPPTNFFASGGLDAEGNELEFEEDGERISIALDADSFLNQSGKNLPSTLLAWHYRSRSEALISFSNAAFYAGNLFTVPDRQAARSAQPEIVVTAPEQAASNVDALLARPISFHRLERGIYENRRNPAEAAYIAQTVRELLRRDTKFSLGIVAFSQAQQDEIESALDALRATDADFATRLEAEQNREEDEQFCGIFVKNLENVQGDERDIILLSICYAPGPDGRMLMNFGPINQRGGEKRLNVIFSRAKHHMVVVSSIRHEAITNDFNDGANTLKNFLRYAESSSAGDVPNARVVLENLNPLSRKALAPSAAPDAMTDALAAALRERGYEVALQVGQSRFRCDLALRQPGENHYAVGIFVDSPAHYGNANLLERYVTQPAILTAFGWKVMLVLARDWYFEPDAVLDRIERLFHRGTQHSQAAAYA